MSYSFRCGIGPAVVAAGAIAGSVAVAVAGTIAVACAGDGDGVVAVVAVVDDVVCNEVVCNDVVCNDVVC